MLKIAQILYVKTSEDCRNLLASTDRCSN